MNELIVFCLQNFFEVRIMPDEKKPNVMHVVIKEAFGEHIILSCKIKGFNKDTGIAILNLLKDGTFTEAYWLTAIDYKN